MFAHPALLLAQKDGSQWGPSPDYMASVVRFLTTVGSLSPELDIRGCFQR